MPTNKTDKESFRKGFVAGLSRHNVKKIKSDIDGKDGAYVAGYVGGFVLEVGLLVVAYHFGIPVGVLLGGV